MNNIIYKIGLVLSIALLICTLPMPYEYYTIVRFIAMIILGYMAFNFYQNEKHILSITASSLALLFQPFFKIYLNKDVWNIVDIIVAIGLIALWYINKK